MWISYGIVREVKIPTCDKQADRQTDRYKYTDNQIEDIYTDITVTVCLGTGVESQPTLCVAF